MSGWYDSDVCGATGRCDGLGGSWFSRLEALGEASAELREVLYARGHAVRSKPECSAAQMESMTKLKQALDRAPAIDDPPGTEQYKDTLRRTLYTFNETDRRCDWGMSAQPVQRAPAESGGGTDVVYQEQASVFPTYTVVALSVLALGLAAGGWATWRWWQSRAQKEA